MDEEESLLWQDVLDEVVAGRTQNLRCPFCQKGEIALTKPERKERLTRCECKACRRFIEVRLTTD
jgi:hypothetical protein